MKSPDGAFFSAEDADSEGVEGKFYLWTKEEIFNILDTNEGEFISKVFNVKEEGNFNDEYSRHSNQNILHMKQDIDELKDMLGLEANEIEDKIESVRLKLFNEREKRVHPHKDDKILTDWNGLMIASLSKSSQVFKEKKYSDSAKEAADFILENLCSNGRLMHRYRDKEAGVTANLDDYSFLIWGLLELYTAVFDIKYLKAAIELNETLLEHFWDEVDGGFYFTADDAEEVLMREKKTYDSATPSGNSVEILNLIRIARITEDPEIEAKAVKMESTFSENIKRAPTAHTQFITAVDFKVGPSFEVVVVGKPGATDTLKILNTLNEQFIPNKVLILKDPENPEDLNKIAESLKYKKTVDGKATAHVCAAGSCKIPTTSAEEMLKLMEIKKFKKSV